MNIKQLVTIIAVFIGTQSALFGSEKEEQEQNLLYSTQKKINRLRPKEREEQNMVLAHHRNGGKINLAIAGMGVWPRGNTGGNPKCITEVAALLEHPENVLSANLCDNGIRARDLKQLVLFTGLTRLFLENNNLTVLQVFPDLPVLEHLSVRYNDIGGICGDGLPQLPNLKILTADCNPITDISGIREYPNLKHVDLGKTSLKPNDLTPLSCLTKLEQLSLSDHNRATGEEILKNIQLRGQGRGKRKRGDD